MEDIILDVVLFDCEKRAGNSLQNQSMPKTPIRILDIVESSFWKQKRKKVAAMIALFERYLIPIKTAKSSQIEKQAVYVSLSTVRCDVM